MCVKMTVTIVTIVTASVKDAVETLPREPKAYLCID